MQTKFTKIGFHYIKSIGQEFNVKCVFLSVNYDIWLIELKLILGIYLRFKLACLFFYKNLQAMQKNCWNQAHYDAKKESLIQQILSYQCRIQQYEKLERQLKNISTTIFNSQLAQNTKQQASLSRKGSNKSLGNSQKQMAEQSKGRVRKQNNQQRVSSSKKVKIYELQKKLSKLNKQNNQKLSEFISLKRQNEVISDTVKRVSSFIRQEQNRTQELKEQDCQLINSIEQGNIEFQKCKKQLQKISEKKYVHEFEKQSILDKIRIKKRSIQLMRKSDNQNLLSLDSNYIFQGDLSSPSLNYNYFPNQNVVNNLNLLQKQTERTIKVKNEPDQKILKSSQNLFDLSCSKISNHRDHNGQKRKVNFEGMQYEVIDSHNSLESSFQSAFEKQPEYQIKTRLNGIQSTSFPRRLQKETVLFQILKDKVEILSSENCQLNEELFQINKQMISIETEIKHHKTNSALLKSKIKTQNKFIEREKLKNFNNLESVQVLTQKLSKLQGQRGQMRGRLGTRVEQQGLVKMVNITIKKDLQNLKQKVNCIVVYRNILSGKIFNTNK